VCRGGDGQTSFQQHLGDCWTILPLLLDKTRMSGHGSEHEGTCGSEVHP
jgi:hypothetical protein